jgi:hypothetical protein
MPLAESAGRYVARGSACDGLEPVVRTVAPTLLIALLLGCASGSSPSATAILAPAGAPRVLFIGNSLTAVNDLPQMVAALARAAGQPLAVEAIVVPGFSLEDHWNQGTARTAIVRGGWRFVVLQQGPSSLSDSRVNLVEWAGRFGQQIRGVGARPALYSVWPESVRSSVFDDVMQSYLAAATSVDGLFLPAGEAWRAAWRRAPSLQLYGPDGFHPSPQGTYLAALVITARLLERPADGLAQDVSGAGLPAVRLSASERELFEASANEAILAFAGR